MKTALATLFVICVICAAGNAEAQYEYRGYGYGTGIYAHPGYDFSRMYPHRLAPGGTWYRMRAVTPRVQPPERRYGPVYIRPQIIMRGVR